MYWDTFCLLCRKEINVNEGWRALLPKEWADCVLHNPSIGFFDSKPFELDSQPIPPPSLVIDRKFFFSIAKPMKVTVRPIYEMSRSAADWKYSDFLKARSQRIKRP